MQYSQEHLKTMVYAEFGGQTECIMGNWKIENSPGPSKRVMSHGIENFSLPFLQALSLFEFSFIILYRRRPRLLRHLEGIFTSLCTSLFVCSFPASLGLQNGLVNKEIELWVAILDILNYWEGILLYLMYIRLNVCCETCSNKQWPFHIVFF